MAHSVAAHLQVKIADYDRFIRTVIPHYDAVRAVQLDLLAGVLGNESGVVLDLGGGTGALAAAVAERFPAAHVEIWDTDPAMLAVARERCAAYGARVRYVERSFAEKLTPCDAVVACIALHHVKRMENKGNIYTHIHRALRTGGIFANADVTLSSDAGVRAAAYQAWTEFMAGNGVSAAQAKDYYAAWAVDDYYPPLATELSLLSAAGFAEPDCFWRNPPLAVFGGVK